jgi:hypothetical protein
LGLYTENRSAESDLLGVKAKCFEVVVIPVCIPTVLIKYFELDANAPQCDPYGVIMLDELEELVAIANLIRAGDLDPRQLGKHVAELRLPSGPFEKCYSWILDVQEDQTCGEKLRRRRSNVGPLLACS